MRSIVPNLCAASTSSVAAGLKGTAVCGPAVARTLAVVDDALSAEASGSKVRRPFWLTTPCPSWCDAAGEPIGHANHDAFEDRRHTLFGPQIPLTLYPAAIEAGEVDEPELPVLSWMAAQHYLAQVPIVSVTVPLVDEPGGRCEEEVRLTVAEARALRDGLTRLLDALDVVQFVPVGGAR